MGDAAAKPEGKGHEWTAYFDAVAGLPARETLVRALDLFEGGMSKPASACPCREGEVHGQAQSGLPMPPSTPFAIDLGCGEGRDTLELVRRGWRVLGIDSSAEALARLKASVAEHGRAQSGTPVDPSVETRLAAFEHTPLPPADLINASFSIPHCSPKDFPPMWDRIVAAIRPGGRFAGQLFGVNDSWATKPDGVTRTYHTRAQVDAMLAPFEIEHLEEIERPGKTALGEPKYWHVFHIVARKRKDGST